MEKRNFRSLEEILNSIDQEQIEVETIQDDLKTKSKGRIRRFFSLNDYEKQQFKLYRTETKGQIKSKKASIKSKENYLDRLCVFDFDVATQFLADTLAIIEEEEYQKTDLELEEESTSINVAMFTATGVPLLETDTDKEYVCLIATKENKKLISDLDDKDELESSYDIQTALEGGDGKYILLESHDTYTMFDYSEQQVPEKLTKTYPYLSEIIVDLINLRLANPNLSDKQSTDIMLQHMPERYSHLIRASKKEKNK